MGIIRQQHTPPIEQDIQASKGESAFSPQLDGLIARGIAPFSSIMGIKLISPHKIQTNKIIKQLT